MTKIQTKILKVNQNEQINISKLLGTHKFTVRSIYKLDKNLLIQLADDQVLQLEGFYNVNASLELGNGQSLKSGLGAVAEIEGVNLVELESLTTLTTQTLTTNDFALAEPVQFNVSDKQMNASSASDARVGSFWGWQSLSTSLFTGGAILVSAGALAKSTSAPNPEVGPAGPSVAIVEGQVVAGPVIDGHDLYINSYSTLTGELITSEKVRLNPDGTFEVTITGYLGAAVFVLTNGSDGAPDYLDEAMGEAVNLSGALAAVAVLTEGRQIVNVSPISTVVALDLKINLLEMDKDSESLVHFDDPSWPEYTEPSAAASAVTEAIEKNVMALGLTQEEYNGEIQPIVYLDTSGNLQQTNANKYGLLLAALAGLDYNDQMSVTQGLLNLSNEIQILNGQPTLSHAGQAQILRGADASADVSGMSIQQVAAVLAPEAAARAESLDLANMDLTDPEQLSLLSPVIAAFLTANQLSTLSTVNLTALTGDLLSVVHSNALLAWQANNPNENLFELIEPSVISSLTGSQVTTLISANPIALQPSQITLLSPSALSAIPSDVISTLSPAAVGELSSSHLRALNSDQLQALTVDQLAVLDVNQLGGLRASQVAMLSVEQFGGLTADQQEAIALSGGFRGITGDQLAVVNETLISLVPSSRFENLTPAQIESITPGQLANLRPEQLDLVQSNLESTPSTPSPVNPPSSTPDTTPPTVLVSTSNASLTSGATATINFTLSEASDNFAEGDLTVTGGALSNFTGSGTSYSATFTKGSTGTGTVSVASGAFTDAAGNANEDGNDANNSVSMALSSVRTDFTSPTLVITSDLAANTRLARGQTSVITFTFNEPVINFTLDDVRVDRGQISGLTEVSGSSGAVYTATFTPTDDSMGFASIWVQGSRGARFTDVAGNEFAAPGNTFEFGVNTYAPLTADVVLVPGTVANSYRIEVVFSRSAWNFESTSYAITGGVPSPAQGFYEFREVTGAGLERSTFLSNNITLAPGSSGLTFNFASSFINATPGGLAQDDLEFSLTPSVSADTTPPTVLVSTSNASLTSGATATINFTLSEASSNFVEGDVTVAGGTLSNFTGSGTSYSATFTKGATGAGTVSVASGVFTDAAGNANEDGSDANNTVSIALSTPPTVSLAASRTSLLPGESTTVTFTLSEVSNDFTFADLSVTGGTLSGFYRTGPTTYFTNFYKGQTGPGTVSVASGAFTNAASIANQDGSEANNTVNIALTDNTPPTFTVSSNVSSLSTGQTGILTFVFNEDVTMTLASMVAGYKPNGIQAYLAVNRIDNRNYTVEFSPQENLLQSNFQIDFSGYSPSRQIGATDGGGNKPQVGNASVTISIDTSVAYLDILNKINPTHPSFATVTYDDFVLGFGSEFATLTGIQNQWNADPSKMATLNAYLSSMTRTNWQKAELGQAIQAISALYDAINQGGQITLANMVTLQIMRLADQNAADGLIDHIDNNFSLRDRQNWDSVTELQAIVDSDRSPPAVTVSSPTNITYQPTDSISVSSNEVGYVYLVRNGTDLSVFTVNGILNDNETQSFNSISNNNKINKVQITQPGVTEQLSLSGLIGGDYRLFTVDAAGNKSAASTEVFSIPIVPPTVSVNSIYFNNTGYPSNSGIQFSGNQWQESFPFISVSTNAANGEAYLVPLGTTIQNASQLNSYTSRGFYNGVTNNWRLPGVQNVQPGEYVVYVKDSETGGISSASTNKIVVDNTSPVLTDASPSITLLGIGGSIQARSNEQGYIYLLRQGMNQMPDPTSLLDNTSSYSRVQVTANDVGQNLTILATGLQDDRYWIASVDRAGNWSDYSNFNRTVGIDNSPPDAPQVHTTSLGNNTFVSMTSAQYEGVVYIVKNDHAPTTVAQITALQDNHWNSISVPSSNTRTVNDLPGTGLVEGTYNAYYSEASGNLSAASYTTILFDVTAPTVSYSDSRVAGAKRINGSLRSTGSFDFISSESGWAHLVDSTATINSRSDFNQLNYLDRQSQQFQIVNSSTPVSFTLDYSNEGMEGTYKLYIEDSAGNLSLANNALITIDNTAPTVSLDNGNQGNGDHQVSVGTTLTNITIAHTDGTQIATTYLVAESRNPFSLSNILSYGDSQWNAGISSSSTQGSIDTTGLDAGRYKLYASDDVGNLSLAATHFVILV